MCLCMHVSICWHTYVYICEYKWKSGLYINMCVCILNICMWIYVCVCVYVLRCVCRYGEDCMCIVWGCVFVWMWMCLCFCLYMCARVTMCMKMSLCISLCFGVSLYVNIFIHLCVFVYLFLYVPADVAMCLCVIVCNVSMCTSLCTSTYFCVWVALYVYICLRVHAFVCVHVCIHASVYVIVFVHASVYVDTREHLVGVRQVWAEVQLSHSSWWPQASNSLPCWPDTRVPIWKLEKAVASSQYISRRDENGTQQLQDLADSLGPYALFALLLLGSCSHHTHQVPLGTT